MKRVLIVALFGFFNLTITAQNYEWAQSFGGTSDDLVKSIENDASGNSYLTGYFQGSIDFDSGPGVSIFSAVGGQDAFVLKLDANGNFLWVKTFGGLGSEIGLSISIDAMGNIITCGQFNGTADFDPGIAINNQTSAGSFDVFILKLDNTGEFVWIKTFGGSFSEVANDIAVDDIGNVYTTGYFEATVDFDPGAGTDAKTSAGGQDLFVHKLNALGDYVLVKTANGISEVSGFSIAVDNSHNIYTVGRFVGSADFDPNASTVLLTSAGSTDIFIQKLDQNGDFLWAKSIGGTSSDFGFGASCDDFGFVILTGSFSSTVDFDSGPGVFNLTSNGGSDVFILKMDENGNFVWSNSFGGTLDDVAFSIDTDFQGSIYTTGRFRGLVDFDSGAGTSTSDAGVNYGLFVHKLDEFGNFNWVSNVVGISNPVGYALTVDQNGSVYTTGQFLTTGDFDPTIGTTNLSSNGGYDIFIQKLSQCLTNSTNVSISACDSYTWPTNGNTYTISGIYTETLTNVGGCDSVVTLNLTINPVFFEADVVTACDNYTWSVNGNTYSSSGIYSEIFSSINGCDSSHVLNLTINNSELTTETISACDSYTWPVNGVTYSTSGIYSETYTNIAGCDSMVELNLTLHASYNLTEAVTICNNENYELPDGNFVNLSGVYISNLTSINGCDSIIETTVTVIAPNVNTSLSVTTLSADANSASYQWLRCPDYLEISGETNQDFEITENGNYAVEITENGCTDTSDCVVIDFMNFDENANQVFSVFPNPSTGYFHIETISTNAVNVKIYNAPGELVTELILENQSELSLPAGLYYVEITINSGQVQIQKLIVL